MTACPSGRFKTISRAVSVAARIALASLVLLFTWGFTAFVVGRSAETVVLQEGLLLCFIGREEGWALMQTHEEETGTRMWGIQDVKGLSQQGKYLAVRSSAKEYVVNMDTYALVSSEDFAATEGHGVKHFEEDIVYQTPAEFAAYYLPSYDWLFVTEAVILVAIIALTWRRKTCASVKS